MRGSWNHELDQWHTEIDTLALSLCLHYGRLPPSQSLSPLSVWDILTYLKSVSSTQGSRLLARPRWDYISTSSWYIFILFIFHISLFSCEISKSLMSVIVIVYLYASTASLSLKLCNIYLCFFSYVWLQFKAAHILRSGSQIHHMWHHWLQISAKATLQLS